MVGTRIYKKTEKRESIVIGCESSDIGEIALLINFKNVQFDGPKRITERKVRGGTAFMFWRDKNFYSNDLFTLSITGDSGNLFDPNKEAEKLYQYPEPDVVGAAVKGDAAPKEKKELFFRLLALSKEKNYQSSDEDAGKENVFYIDYNSALFSEPIRFWGHFETALTFSDVADDPFHVEFSFNFKVYYSEPDFIDYYDSIKAGITNG